MTHGPDAAHVPIGPVRDHLRTLNAQGCTVIAIADALGLAQPTVTNWLRVKPSQTRKVMTRIHALTARRVLQLTAETVQRTQPRDAEPTRRRLDALLAAGHGPRVIAEVVRGRAISAATVTAELAEDVAVAYERLAATQPVHRDPELRAAARAASAAARSRGALPPGAWRDIEASERRRPADDPSVDYAAVDAVLAGRWRRLTDAEYLAAIDRMREGGRNWHAIATTLRLAPSSLRKSTYPRLVRGEQLHLADRAETARLGAKGTLVPLAPVVEHLRELEAGGAPLTAIARSATVSLAGIRNYLGRTARAAPEYVRQATAQRILAVTLDSIPGLDPRVDPAPTARRVRALATRGWPPNLIATTIGVGLGMIASHIDRDTIASSAHAAVAELYTRVAFADRLPEYPSATARGQAMAYQRDAIAAGWHGPMDWADIELGILDEDVDTEVARARVWERNADADLRGQVRTHMQTLLDAGLSYAEIARRANISASTVWSQGSALSGGDAPISPSTAERLLAVQPTPGAVAA